MPHQAGTDLGGLEALKRIRALTPSTRVVIYSGLLEPDVKRQAIAGGAVAVLAKPAALDDLREIAADPRWHSLEAKSVVRAEGKEEHHHGMPQQRFHPPQAVVGGVG